MEKPKESPEPTGKKQEGRDEKGRFKPGVSGNPNGRIAGSRNFNTDFDEVVDEIAKANNIPQSEARKILLKKAYAMAKDGEFPFYKDLMDRVYGKPIETIDLGVTGSVELKKIQDDTKKLADAIAKAVKRR